MSSLLSLSLLIIHLFRCAISVETQYYESYDYDLDLIHIAHEPAPTIISIGTLNIEINSLTDIFIHSANIQRHLNYLNDTDWDQLLTIQYLSHSVEDAHNASSRRQLLSRSQPRYKLSPVSMNWYAARSYCVQHYGAMASIMSWRDNSDAKRFCPFHCWIGLIEENGKASTFTKWDNGRRVEFTHWAPGEPNNDRRTGSDCGEIYGGRWAAGVWNDLPCNHKRFVLCEEGRGQLVGNYIAVQTPKSYADADEYCMHHYGTHLATIHDSTDNQQVKKGCNKIGARGYDNECWIGLKGPFKKWQDGVYTQGFGKFSAWYHEQSGVDVNRWRLILRLQDISKGYFKPEVKQSGVENPGDMNANTYSIIGQLRKEDYQNPIDKKYKFKLVYKNKNGGESVLIWSQSSWLTQSDIIGFEPEDMPGQSASSCTSFMGLALSGTASTFLDGNGRGGCWWNSVGTISPHNGGIPAFNLQIATSEALYIYEPQRMTNVCGNIHKDGKWYDTFCGEQKHFVCNAMAFAERLPPFMRKNLQQAAYQKHYLEWTNQRQIEYMKEEMKKNMQKEDVQVNNPVLRQEEKWKEEEKKQKVEELRQKLEKQGYFKQFEKQGYFSQPVLDSAFGHDQKLSFPVKWGSRRLLVDAMVGGEEEMVDGRENVQYMQCVYVERAGEMQYRVCVGEQGIQVLSGGSAREKGKYKVVMEESMRDQQRYCLLKYLCVQISGGVVDVEVIEIEAENFSLQWMNDEEWDEVVAHVNRQSVEKCVRFLSWKVCVQKVHDKRTGAYCYRLSLLA